eukprot:gb/GECG01003634.1/.p1 GENE.gb/GECG01003634.1/~~gb/GECG01003634.1/.p1  ORF type:complete len:493 (+),score=83.57 gb/GECG01003634.1/:1-1479(+)
MSSRAQQQYATSLLQRDANEETKPRNQPQYHGTSSFLANDIMYGRRGEVQEWMGPRDQLQPPVGAGPHQSYLVPQEGRADRMQPMDAVYETSYKRHRREYGEEQDEEDDDSQFDREQIPRRSGRYGDVSSYDYDDFDSNQGFALRQKPSEQDEQKELGDTISETGSGRRRGRRRVNGRATRRGAEVQDDGRSSAFESETGSMGASQSARPEDEDEEVGEDEEGDEEYSQDDRRVMDEEELKVRRTRRGVYKSKKKDSNTAATEEAGNEYPKKKYRRRRNAPGRRSKTRVNSPRRKKIVKRSVSNRDIEIVFDLCNEPCLKYNIAQVLDPGTDYTDWTSFKLKERTIYMDTVANRYEICREDSASEDGFDQYRISKVKRCRSLGIRDMANIQIPLPESELDVLHRHVQWDEIFWASEGVEISDLKLKLHCLRFCLNIQPLHHEELQRELNDIDAIEETFRDEFPVDPFYDEPEWEVVRKIPEFMNAYRSFKSE